MSLLGAKRTLHGLVAISAMTQSDIGSRIAVASSLPLPLPPLEAAVQERIPLRATFTERFSNESDDLLVGVIY
jgi:hypothetical protein